MTDRLLLTLLGLLLGSTAMALSRPAEMLITQKNREFSVQEASIAAGGRLLFSNDDDFPHQISASGPGVTISSPLQRPGETLNIPLPQAGTVQIRCGIHPRMRLTVQVD